MIAIINYGLGNVQALYNVYKHLNVPVRIANTAEDLADVSHLILPGVGSFDHAMELFGRSQMAETVNELVLVRKVPILGICIGMQMLSSNSEEGEKKGLAWVGGAVKKMSCANGEKPLMLPHMGWNDVTPVGTSKLFEGLEENARFYFLHSYYFECDDESSVLANSDYEGKFSCAVSSENVFGVQFHPEKSHQFGIQLLKNFSEFKYVTT